MISTRDAGGRNGGYADQAGGGDGPVWQSGGWVIRRRCLIYGTIPP
jgi:hypothetical protein